MKAFLLLTLLMGSFSYCYGEDTNVHNLTAAQYQKYLTNQLHGDKRLRVDVADENSAQLMYDEATSIGNQGGMYWASQQIETYLSQKSYILDNIDFTPLVISYPKYDVLPVVVIEDDGRRQLSEKSKVFRVLGKTYFIESEPKLLINVPTWRDYLYVDAVPPAKPHQSFEKLITKYPELWEKGIKAGWRTGVDQAIYVIQTRLSRLTRDYIGLVRYHLLSDANMISKPIINEVYRPVSGGGNILSIEDTIVTIDISPKLSTDRYNWKAIPRLPDVSHLFPDILQSSFIQGLKQNGAE